MHDLYGMSNANILIVDDTPANLHILTDIIKSSGHKARPTPSGALALQAALMEAPDLVLLDVRMPGMDGYEVCRRLKEQPSLQDVPVIFLSALTDHGAKLEAFRAGGVDYITKPFQVEEVKARVGAHLRLRRLQTALQSSNDELSRALSDLRELEGLRDGLFHMLVHDMRSPLSALALALEIIHDDHEATMPQEDLSLIAQARGSVQSLIGMVSSVLDVSRMESGRMPVRKEDCDLGEIAREAVGQLSLLRGDRTTAVNVEGPSLRAPVDRDLTLRVLQNLVGNAIKFTAERGGEITIDVRRSDGAARVSVIDNGEGIAPEHQQIIFEKFGQVVSSREGRKNSTGLGLTFCRLAVEAQGGKIGVHSALGRGSVFWFELPL